MTKRQPLEGFAERLQKAIVCRGTTYTALARQTRCSRKTMATYVRGDTTPTVMCVAKICYALGVSAEWLVMGRGGMHAGNTGGTK